MLIFEWAFKENLSTWSSLKCNGYRTHPFSSSAIGVAFPASFGWSCYENLSAFQPCASPGAGIVWFSHSLRLDRSTCPLRLNSCIWMHLGGYLPASIIHLCCLFRTARATKWNGRDSSPFLEHSCTHYRSVKFHLYLASFLSFLQSQILMGDAEKLCHSHIRHK